MYFKKFIWLFCLCFSWLSHANDYHLNINTEVMVPYNFYNESNDIVGINVDIIKAILKRTNINATFNLYPWVRSYKLTLNEANAGLISTARTPEREKLFKWVGPLASGKGFLYQLSSRNDIHVNSIEDAKQYLVAVVRGDVYQKLFQDLGFELNKNLILFSYNAEYTKPFLAGKVDLILGSDIVLPYILSENGSDISAVKPVIKIPDTQGNYLALNNKVPDAVVDKLNKALIELKTQQEYQQIINRYRN